MVIKILGKGCKKCDLLESHVKEAVKELGIDATIEKVTDIDKISDYGVLSTPALVIDEEVKVSGRVLTTSKLKKLLS